MSRSRTLLGLPREFQARWAAEVRSRTCSGFIVAIVQPLGQELMTRVAHAANVDLRLGDAARDFVDFGVGAGPGNFARERFNLFGQGWIGINGQAQRVAKRVLGRASAAPRGFRAGAGPGVCAVCPDLPLSWSRCALCFRRRLLDHFELALNFLQVPPQRFAEYRTTPIDLAEHDVAASLGDGD